MKSADARKETSREAFNLFCTLVGRRQVGKAPGFDPGMRWFESSRPSTYIYENDLTRKGGVILLMRETAIIMANIEQLVHAFIATLRAGNVEKAVTFFSADGRYHEAGTSPFVGHAAIGKCLGAFVALDRPWDFVVDDVISTERNDKAAVVYRFLIEGGNGEQLERAGCALVKRSGEQFVEWREYTG